MQGDKDQVANRRNLAPHPPMNLTSKDPSVPAAHGHLTEDGFRDRSRKVVRSIHRRDHGSSLHQGPKSRETSRLIELPFVIVRAMTSDDYAARLPAFDLRIKVRRWPRYHDRLANWLAQRLAGSRNDSVNLIVENVYGTAAIEPAVGARKPQGLLPWRHGWVAEVLEHLSDSLLRLPIDAELEAWVIDRSVMLSSDQPPFSTPAPRERRGVLCIRASHLSDLRSGEGAEFRQKACPRLSVAACLQDDGGRGKRNIWRHGGRQTVDLLCRSRGAAIYHGYVHVVQRLGLGHVREAGGEEEDNADLRPRTHVREGDAPSQRIERRLNHVLHQDLARPTRLLGPRLQQAHQCRVPGRPRFADLAKRRL
jgi:hypothetical protein